MPILPGCHVGIQGCRQPDDNHGQEGLSFHSNCFRAEWQLSTEDFTAGEKVCHRGFNQVSGKNPLLFTELPGTPKPTQRTLRQKDEI